jgi:hypothetical protein
LDLVQVTTDIWEECRMSQKSSEVGCGSWKGLREFVIKQRRKSTCFEDRTTGLLIMKQAKLGDKADVGQRDVVAH